jgi:hypothetical protein
MSDVVRFSPEFVGNEFVVKYEVERETHTGYTRGDHYDDGGEYVFYTWGGWVTVRNKSTGEACASCACGVNRARSFNLTSEGVRKQIFVDEVLSDMKESYADFIAKRVIEVFKKDRSGERPYIELERPPQEELLKAGLVLDANGQRTLALI